MSTLMRFLLIGWVLVFGVAACSPRGEREQVSGGSEAQENPGSSKYDDLEIVTLLPRDGIPAIDHPQFLSATEADEEYAPDELVIGVNYDGDARAYSIPYLSGHEIVNDTVGGRKISVTW